MIINYLKFVLAPVNVFVTRRQSTFEVFVLREFPDKGGVYVGLWKELANSAVETEKRK